MDRAYSNKKPQLPEPARAQPQLNNVSADTELALAIVFM